MSVRKLTKLFIIIFVALLFKVENAFSQEKINVVATFSIIGDLVKNVGGDKINLKVLVGENADAHAFEPTPQESIELTKAKIIYEIGIGFEHWLNDIYLASGTKAKRVVLTKGLSLIYIDHEEIDPHVWHDVTNVVLMVNIITDSLIAVDPTNAEFYQNNAKSYIDQLNQLDQWMLDEVQKIPETRRKLITSHDTFGYFAKRYGFEVIGSIIDSRTTEAQESSALKMAQLVEEIKKVGVPAVFAENIKSSKLSEVLALEAKIKVAPQLYTDALGELSSEGATYIGMMKYNVNVFVAYLR